MKSVLINGELWKVNRVSPGSPLLIDRTGKFKVATTDAGTRLINVSNQLVPPLLDRVLLHEIAHAITVSYGLLPILRNEIHDNMWIPVEEWSASLMERHAVEASVLASQILGRPLCINGYCIM